MQPFDLLLISLATFYLAYAISGTHGPFHIFELMRTRFPIGGLTECLVCLSPWLALLFAVLLLTPLAFFVWILAAAGISVLLWRYTGANAI